MLTPSQKIPLLNFPLLNGVEFDILKTSPKNFDLIVFYRGLHCRFCASHLQELKEIIKDYNSEGVDVYAISSDTQERSIEFQTKVNVSQINFGYGLNLKVARSWGLYISAGIGTTSIGIEEPQFFSEPGIFLIKPDKTLYYAEVQSMPFSRPPFKDLLNAIKFSNQKNYPARGEYTGEL